MNARILGLLSVLVLASGCVVHNHDNYYNNPGDVTFSWTFEGGGCPSNVASVVVAIPGQTLQPDTFACMTNGYPGITLTNFDSGGYNYTVTAYDSQGTALYSATGAFVVDGNTTVLVDLKSTGNAGSKAWISWSFATPSKGVGPTCGSAAQGGDMPSVRVTIDGYSDYQDCTAGVGSNAVPYTLTPGQHTLEIAAVIKGTSGNPADDYVFAGTQSSLTTTATQDTAQSYTLAWQVGGAAVDWAFFSADGNTQYPDCTTAGVNTIRVNFYTPSSSTYLYPYPAGDFFACPTNSNTVVYNALPPGNYDVSILADNSAGGSPTAATIKYLNDLTKAPITIVAGAFPTSSSAPTPPTPLYRQ